MGQASSPISELAGTSQTILTPQLLEAGVRRVRIMAFFGWVVSAAYILLIWSVFPRDHALWKVHFPKYVTTASMLLFFALATCLVTYSKRLSAKTIIDLGLVLLFLFAFSASLFRHSHEFLPEMAWREWAPTSVVLLLVGTMVPAKPSRILKWGLLVALTDPLALGIMISIGWSKPPMAIQWLMIPFTPFVSALMAYACSKVVFDLGTRIREAEQLGSYRLVKKLGAGGMGEVWLAKHNFLARPAAIKLVKQKADEAENQIALRRFELEAQETANLRSPHTVEIYDFGVSDSGAFYYGHARLLFARACVQRGGAYDGATERSLFPCLRGGVHAHGTTRFQIGRPVQSADVPPERDPDGAVAARVL